MRLLRVTFENFRLLRDLELEFSSDPERKLTVIRAANETGKTTILTGLQWGLYGDAALPGKGEDFRLHPIDWEAQSGIRVPINVTVDFEVIRYNNIRGQVKESRKNYRLVRSAFEDVQGAEWRRSPSTVRLFALDATGATPIDTPELFINEELPPELRDVFFTDGDRALSFIESDVAVSTKRERVQRAIRSLLGLGVIEEAMKHVKKAASEVNKGARALGGSGDLDKVLASLIASDAEIAKQETLKADASEQFIAFDEKLRDIRKSIEDALRKGDKERLRADLESTRKSISKLDDRIVVAQKEHSNLFRTESIARDLLGPVMKPAFETLGELHDRGKIPNATIPVLEERLSTGTCICGDSLADDGAFGSQRRAYISKLIEESRKADEIQGIVTELYYGSKSIKQLLGSKDAGWISQYTKVVENRDSLGSLRDEEGRKLKALELQIDSLPDSDIQGLREIERNYRDQRDRFNAKQATVGTQIDNLKRDQIRLEAERDRLLREKNKGAKVIAELEATGDIYAVLERAYSHITKEELAKVSALMNKLFLEMIGADPVQGAIINEAAISSEFDIVVHGPQNRTLSPDRDLNGASRRALTLAFILALTKVSEVEAPNVIDTPLGMMSGFVKRSVLRTAIRQSSQLILFLTHDEIAGCEEILDNTAGAIYTLTNPVHFPKMLVHDPGIRVRKVLRCNCNHRSVCEVCERNPDIEPVSELNTEVELRGVAHE